MKFFLTTLILLLSMSANALEIYPKGCKPVVIKGQQVVLTKKTMLLMLHNLSNNELWLTHPMNNNPGLKAGFSSHLSAGKWSTLALNTKNLPFRIACIEARPGHEQQVPCESVLAICNWPKAKQPEDASSVFWVGENMNLSALIAYVERLGFTLREEST